MKKKQTLFLIFIAVGCVTYSDEISQMNSLYRNSQYQEALKELEASSLKDNKNRLLYHMEKGMILERMGDKKKARDLLDKASRISDELYTTSVSKTAASFIVNESTQDYEGESYEKIAVHTIKALSYLENSMYSEARVEARKINNKLYQITQNLGDKHNSYREDAFARYLAGLICHVF